MLPLLTGEFRAGGDAELRFIPSGQAVANFSIIANAAKRGEDGEWVNTAETPWIRVNCWRQMAERAAEEVTRGCRIYVTGRLKSRKWKDDDGNEHESIELDCEAFQVIPPRDSGGSQPRTERQHNPANNPADPWGTPTSDPNEPPF